MKLVRDLGKKEARIIESKLYLVFTQNNFWRNKVNNHFNIFMEKSQAILWYLVLKSVFIYKSIILVNMS